MRVPVQHDPIIGSYVTGFERKQITHWCTVRLAILRPFNGQNFSWIADNSACGPACNRRSCSLRNSANVNSDLAGNNIGFRWSTCIVVDLFMRPPTRNTFCSSIKGRSKAIFVVLIHPFDFMNFISSKKLCCWTNCIIVDRAAAILVASTLISVYRISL